MMTQNKSDGTVMLPTRMDMDLTFNLTQDKKKANNSIICINEISATLITLFVCMQTLQRKYEQCW